MTRKNKGYYKTEYGFYRARKTVNGRTYSKNFKTVKEAKEFLANISMDLSKKEGAGKW